MHVLIEGHLERTVPSNLSEANLCELRLRDAHPAGPPPAAPAIVRAGDMRAGEAIEIDRAVDSSGNITLGPVKLKLGTALANGARLRGPGAGRRALASPNQSQAHTVMRP